MVALYISSWEEAAGKTALCAGIGRHLQSRGKRVGYLKPLVLTTQPSPVVDRDAQFIKQALELEESAENLCLFKFMPQAPKERKGKFRERLKHAYSEVAKDKDVVLLEGWGGWREDNEFSQASYQIAETLEAKVILVLRYIRGLFWDRIAPDKGGFGERLLGVIINQVPQAGRESISAELTSQVPGEGIKILGMLPEERGLLSISLGELAEHLRATVLCCPDALDKLVGNVMVGALCVDSGADYFARRGDKVVITRGERPDIQLAALATSTNCLVLTGDVTPLSEVLRWAEEKGVPILSTKQDTLPTVAGAEEALLQARFRQQNKLKTVEEILARYIDLEALYQDLGIS